MPKIPVGLLLPVLYLMFLPAEAGHEMPYYPSYYPQEIRIEALAPDTAATLLQHNKLHAFIGGEPHSGVPLPANVRAIGTLGSYLVVTFDSAVFPQEADRCLLAQKLLGALAGAEGSYVFHPYPVTPYHWDYLHHFDRVEAAKALSQRPAVSDQRAAAPALNVRARGPLAEHLVRSRWQGAAEGGAVTLEEIPLDDLLSAHATSLNGWLGPPWLKEGWFHAYLLLAATVSDRTVRESVEAAYRRLIQEPFDGLEARLNAERDFVALLRRGCERTVAGYAVRREYFNAEFSAGIENLAYDAHTGFNSAIFLRTVKLKDLPWNGWLRLGVPTKPAAAWNPMGGFTDATGRLVWYAVGDPALFPSPYSGSWMPNRVAEYQLTIVPLGHTPPAQVTDKP